MASCTPVAAAEAIKRHGVGVQVCDHHTRRDARAGVRPQGDVPLAEWHDPQHPRRRRLQRADRDLKHPSTGAGGISDGEVDRLLRRAH